MPRWTQKTPTQEAKARELRLAKQRDYNQRYQEKKRAEREALEAAGGTPTSNYAKYKSKTRITPAERSRLSKAVWRAKKAADLEASMPTVKMETTVDVPHDIEPGILATGNMSAENGMMHTLPPLPTGATLLAEVMASFRKMAIVIKEVGAEHGTFTWADGSVITVRGDGSVTSS